MTAVVFARAAASSSAPGLGALCWLAVAVTACEPTIAGDCGLPDLSSLRTGVISIPERSAFAPDVHRERSGGLVAFVPSVIFGDGAVYRSTSGDGLDWSEPARVLDQEHSFGDFGVLDAFVFQIADGPFVALYATTRNEAPSYVFGVATSDDGESFAKSHVGFFGSNTLGQDGNSLDGQEIHNPSVWFDGTTYHLYYSGFAGRIIDGDLGYTVASIGHAVAVDGLNYTFESWIYESEPCGEGEVATSMDMVLFGRSACPCDTAGVVMVADGNLCGAAGGSFLLRSEDGTNFSAPVLLPERPGAGTLLIDPSGRGVAYVGDYSDLSAVAATPVVLEAGDSADACR